MKKNMMYTATVLALSSSLYVSAEASAFSDMEGHWSKTFVSNAANAGLMTGTGGGKFTPDRVMTAGEFAVVVVNGAFAGETLAQSTDSHWSDPFINVLEENGLYMDGKGQSVVSTGARDWQDSDFTRIQTATVIARLMDQGDFLKGSGSEGSDLQDLSSLSEGRQEDVRDVLANGIMAGTGKYFGTGALTRGEASVVISSMLDQNIIQSMEEGYTPEMDNSPQVDYESIYGALIETICKVADDRNFDHTSIGLPYYLGMDWYTGSLADMRYDFVDVNGDAVPEMFVFMQETQDGASGLASCYTIKDGTWVSLIGTSDRIGYYLTQDLYFAYWASMGAADQHSALMKLNQIGDLDYVSYFNRALADPNVWDGNAHDYLVFVENGKINLDNRRIATAAELAEFNAIYEGARYQFQMKPFVTDTTANQETSTEVSGFYGYGLISDYNYSPLDTPDPSGKGFGNALSRLYEPTIVLAYYGGLNVEYYVEDGDLFLTYPNCIYGFYMGQIADPNMKEGDFLYLNGSEIVQDIICLTDEGVERMKSYDPTKSLLEYNDARNAVEKWLATRSNSAFLMWFGDLTELRDAQGNYTPVITFQMNYGSGLLQDISIDRYTHEIFVDYQGNPRFDADAWYRNFFGT